MRAIHMGARPFGFCEAEASRLHIRLEFPGVGFNMLPAGVLILWTLDQKNEVVTVDTIPPSTVCWGGEAPGAAARMLFKQNDDVVWSDEDW